MSPAGAIQPRLAERWENKDNLLWTFHLRPGLTWSDGTAITAQDIVWSWQRLVYARRPPPPTPATLAICISPTPARLPSGKRVPETLGVKALNDTTLQVTLTQHECRLPGDAGAPFAGTDRQSAGGAVCR
ncbi:ABC transporter substrate-binding protein [Klebsiella pneumoniae]